MKVGARNKSHQRLLHMEWERTDGQLCVRIHPIHRNSRVFPIYNFFSSFLHHNMLIRFHHSAGRWRFCCNPCNDGTRPSRTIR